MAGAKRSGPRILGAFDLTHLDPDQRLRLVGRKRFANRRSFLVELLGAGACIALPPAMLSACGGDDGSPTPEQCPSDEGCTAYAGCDCDTDSTPSCTTDGCSAHDSQCPCQTDASTPDLVITLVSPQDGATDVSTTPTIILETNVPVTLGSVGYLDPDDMGTLRVRSNFDEVWTDGNTHLELVPEPGEELMVGYTYDVYVQMRAEGSGKQAILRFTFTTEGPACTCEADNPCSCQSDTCTCVSFTCPCQFEGCPTYGI